MSDVDALGVQPPDAVVGGISDTHDVLDPRVPAVFVGVDVLLVHKLAMREIEALLPSAGVVVSGHTHVPSINLYGEVLYLNPGSASQPRQADGRRTVALLEIRRGCASARILPL